jgi:hypothetical protein
MFLKKRTPTISWLDPQCHRLKHPNIAWVCPDTGYTGIPQVITIEPWETWCCNPWHGMGYSTLAKSCLRQPSIEPFWNRNCKNGERTQGHGNRTQKGVPFSNLQAAQDFVEEGETETEASRAACNQLGIRVSLPIPFLLARLFFFRQTIQFLVVAYFRDTFIFHQKTWLWLWFTKGPLKFGNSLGGQLLGGRILEIPFLWQEIRTLLQGWNDSHDSATQGSTPLFPAVHNKKVGSSCQGLCFVAMIPDISIHPFLWGSNQLIYGTVNLTIKDLRTQCTILGENKPSKTTSFGNPTWQWTFSHLWWMIILSAHPYLYSHHFVWIFFTFTKLKPHSLRNQTTNLGFYCYLDPQSTHNEWKR